MIDLTEKLEVGDVIYDFVNDRRVRVVKNDPSQDMPISVKGIAGKSKAVSYNKFGSILPDGVDCFLFPSKESRDWNEFIRPAPYNQGDIVISKHSDGHQRISVFSHSLDGVIYVYGITDDGIAPVKVDEVFAVPKSCDALFYKKISNKPGRHLLKEQQS